MPNAMGTMGSKVSPCANRKELVAAVIKSMSGLIQTSCNLLRKRSELL